MQFKLANLIFSGNQAFDQFPTLSFRELAGRAISDSPSSLRLLGSSCVDFSTYFNSLSIMKWKEYSNAGSFYLHFKYRGAGFDFQERTVGNLDWSSRVVPDSNRSFSSSDVWASVDIEITEQAGEILHSFSIESAGDLTLDDAYYYADVDPCCIHPVELALAITTFKKEQYVLNNLNLIKEGILSGKEPISEHFHVHVVDNGRSLDCNSGSDRISIHPNPNVGGSGGFARGMIEALEQNPKATHVLLMDDDVEVLPESFIRTFNLLSLLKEKYVNAFLSGAMMSLEEPNLRTEDLGFFTAKGTFSPLKPEGYMTSLHDVVETEIYKAPTGLYEDTAQQYAGWWYCVIPTATIEREGLPLPLFVRSDDAEYALRCKPRFMSMNGICVWHNSFKFKYSAAVERYQVSRNTLISQATTGVAPLADFLYEIRREVELDLKKFDYDDALLAVKGLEDF